MNIPPEVWKETLKANKNRFDYARGYFTVTVDGTVYIDRDAPSEVRERFPADWEEHLKEVKARRDMGMYTSHDLIGFTAECASKIVFK